LGPLLSLVYVNNIGNFVSGAKVKRFADDINLFVSHESIGTLNNKVNCDTSLLRKWFVANKLSLNLYHKRVIW
jgi:hypothetical protein